MDIIDSHSPAGKTFDLACRPESVKMLDDGIHGLGLSDDSSHFHVPVECIVGEIRATDHRELVDHRALHMELAGFSGLVAFPFFKRPVKQADFVEIHVLEGLAVGRDDVRKCSELALGVVAGPAYWGSLPILMNHRGADIALGITSPE